MFCLRILVLQLPSIFFQINSPFVLSTDQMKRLSPSATFRKMRSSHMTGVAPVQLGIVSFQVTFSSALQRVGRFFSPLRPLRDGPRHCGQFSANADVAIRKATTPVKNSLLRTSVHLPVFLECLMVDHSERKMKRERACP